MKIKCAVRAMLLCAMSIVAGCGGGGESASASSTPSLSGVAAVGSPIVGGAINVRCAAGSALAPVSTGSTGAWQTGISGQTLPCAVQVSGGTINGAANATPYHSITTAAGTVNVTPLTDLMVANLAGTATPDVWFNGLGATPAPLTTITQTNVDTALTNLRSALPALTPLGTINPITTAFTSVPGNTSDDMLAALATAMTNSGGVTHASLLISASAPTITPPAGFGTALGTAYAGTSSGGASAIPAIPMGVSATASGSTQIDLNWVNVSGATGYNLYRSASANVQIVAGNKINAAPVQAGPFQNTGLTVSTIYYYKVTAVNAAGESVGSVEVSATTSAAANLPFGYVSQGGLIWMPVTFVKYWQAADTYCTTSTINGVTGWRMPTLAELSALYTSGAMNGQGWALAQASTLSSTQYGAGYHYAIALNNGVSSPVSDTAYVYNVSCVLFGSGIANPITATATTTAQNLNIGVALASFTPLVASGGTTPYTYSYTGTLPAGLSFNTSTGAVTGTPTAVTAIANLVFSVKDANNVVAGTTSTVSFSVAAAGPLPVGYVSQAGLTWMPVTFYDTHGNAYAYCVNTAINGVTGWRMPTQAELSSLYNSGAMNSQGWTLGYTWSTTQYPIAGSHYSLNLVLGTGGWYNDTNNYYVSCVRGNGVVSTIVATATTTAQTLTEGIAMASFTPLVASGGTTPYTYSYAGTLPAGLSFNTSTGAVTGTPTAASANAELVFSVVDVNGALAGTTSTVGFSVASAAAALPTGYVSQGGLTWMPVGATYGTWAVADAYCANTVINGLTGWRMPTQLELSALATNGLGWVLLNTWSSTPGSIAGRHYAVDLSNGTIYNDADGSIRFVSCVR